MHTAARLGADAVEIDARDDLRPGQMSQTGLRELRKLLDGLNLRVAAVSFVTRRGYDVVEDLEARIDATKAAMNFAYSLRAPVVVNRVGRIAQDGDDARRQRLLAVLSDLGAYGHHTGAMLAAKTGQDSPDDVLSLFQALPSGCLAVDLDPGGLIVNGVPPLEMVEKLGESILHVRARDGVRDLAQGVGVETALGRGAVDFPALLASLDERGYSGYLTLERRGGEDPIFEIGQGVKYLKNL